jgi:hypothetical protein
MLVYIQKYKIKNQLISPNFHQPKYNSLPVSIDPVFLHGLIISYHTYTIHIRAGAEAERRPLALA